MHPSPLAWSDHSAALLDDILQTQNDLATVELDPQLIMRMVAERAQKLTRADGAAIQLVENGCLVFHAVAGIMGPLQGRSVSMEGTLAGYALRGGDFQYSADVQE